MLWSVRSHRTRVAVVCTASALLAARIGVAGPTQPPIVTSGEFILADLNDDGLVDEASIDWITFDVTARTSVNFDALIIESIYSPSGDINGDGEITRADGGMVLFDSDGNILVVHDDAPPNVYGNDGSISRLDGNFDYMFEVAGTYTLAISANGYFLTPEDALAGYIDYRIIGPAFRDANGDPVDHADWQLTLNVLRGSVSNVRVNTLGMPATPNPVAAAACTYLWPPNHRMQSVGLDLDPSYDLLIFSNDPSADPTDVAIDNDSGLQLRAERSGGSIGRVYLVIALTPEEEGAELIDCCTVVVPHDKSEASMMDIEAEAILAQFECLHNNTPPDGYQLIAP